LNGALADYRRTLELQPDSVYAYVQLGVSLYKSGSIDDAHEILEKGTRLQPKSPELANYWGEILLDQAKYSEGKKYGCEQLFFAMHSLPLFFLRCNFLSYFLFLFLLPN